MECLICGEAAMELPKDVRVAGVGRDCPHCGRYWIAESLLQATQGMKFDVEATRYYLALLRELGDTVPVLSNKDLSLLN